MNDDGVRATSEDALISKLLIHLTRSAIDLGYIDDPFVQVFLKKAVRRAPIMNRGTFTRCYAIDRIISKFLEVYGPNSQIISIGAGSDTRWLNLKAAGKAPGLYIEIDFPQSTGKKAMAMCKNKLSKAMFSTDMNVVGGGTEIKSQDYCLMAGDLRDFAQSIMPRMVKLGIDKTIPTLFLSECVLIYLEPNIGDSIIQQSREFTNPFFVTYEQILPDDPFGKTMLTNLKVNINLILMRDLSLPGIHKYPTIEAQEERYLNMGYSFVQCQDLLSVWEKNVTAHEKDRSNLLIRISKLEIFDEFEEWKLLMSHYCLTLATLNPQGRHIWFSETQN